ncbi:MAG: hypothetical protein MUE67_03895 [Anaerolineales bacterium]|nr:hypothetical protein [Anaerolineales bacterium]
MMIQFRLPVRLAVVILILALCLPGLPAATFQAQAQSDGTEQGAPLNTDDLKEQGQVETEPAGIPPTVQGENWGGNSSQFFGEAGLQPPAPNWPPAPFAPPPVEAEQSEPDGLNSSESSRSPAPATPESNSTRAAHGILYFSQDSNANGLYRLDTTTGTATLIGQSGVDASTVGLAPSENPNYLYGSKPFGLMVTLVDGTSVTQRGTTGIEGLAFNISTKVLYGILNGDFFTVDPATGLIATDLVNPSFDVEGLAADPFNNKIYGIGDGNNLVVYDIAGNAWSTVGNTGRNWNSAGLDYDPIDRVLYAVSSNQGNTLYRINPTTAAVTTVGPTGISGMGGGLAYVQAALNHLAVTWSDGKIHLLDRNLVDLGSFIEGSDSPNGIATDGRVIYTGHFDPELVIAHDYNGNELFRWSAVLSGLQGMELVGADLAIYRGLSPSPVVDFFNPRTGAFLRSIPGQSSVEGLAYDGTLLWQLGDANLIATNPSNGAVVRTIPNAASGCDFSGTGLTAYPPLQLTIACTDGKWYRVSTADGAILAAGDNNLDMFGLKRVPPTYVAATWSDDRVHFLDHNLIDQASFPAGSTNPNGIATDGALIYNGQYSPQEVVGHNFNGEEKLRWTASLTGLQGMDLVGGNLAIYKSGSPAKIDFHNPSTGALVRSIPGPASTEGLAFDGRVLWALDDPNLLGLDPANGNVLRQLPNPAASCSFGGTGLAYLKTGHLVIGCANGRWYKISMVNGAVVASGANGLDIYGLKATPFQEAPTFLPFVNKNY